MSLVSGRVLSLCCLSAVAAAVVSVEAGLSLAQFDGGVGGADPALPAEAETDRPGTTHGPEPGETMESDPEGSADEERVPHSGRCPYYEEHKLELVV